jgi:hypothetical protein
MTGIWDKSISSLYDLITQIQNTDIKTTFICELNCMVNDGRKDTKTSILRNIW